MTIPYPEISPIAFHVGPIAVRWYGIMYLLGYAVGDAIAKWRSRRGLWRMVTDGLAVCATPGLFLGRIGNFINAELYGRPTQVPWAMVFPTDPLGVPRHPSQLYEALAEGVLLGALLFWLQSRIARHFAGTGTIKDGYLSAAFLIGYGVLRFAIEFTRQPDAQLGFVFGPLSMGQLLSALMIAVGVVMLTAARHSDPRSVGPEQD